MRQSASKNATTVAIIFLAALALFMTVRGFLYGSAYFKLKRVSTESMFLDQRAVSSVNNQILKNYGGRNIFNVPLNGIGQSLKRIYPDAKDISVRLILPDRLTVTIRFRRPVALVRDFRLYPVDDEGFVLASVSPIYLRDLPVIEGAGIRYSEKRAGKSSSERLRMALELLGAVRSSRYLSQYGVASINTSNMSNMSYRMKNGIEVFAGSDDFPARLAMLEGTLRDPRLDKGKIRYIDISTKDVVIGPKSDK
jgi:cell division septal protein FtsQ